MTGAALEGASSRSSNATAVTLDGLFPAEWVWLSAVQKVVLWKSRARCGRCGKRIETTRPWQIDHIIPRCMGGGNELDNLQAIHTSCNGVKGGVWEAPKDARRKQVARTLRAPPESKPSVGNFHRENRGRPLPGKPGAEQGGG